MNAAPGTAERAFERFVAGEDGLATALRSIARHEPPAGMAERFAVALDGWIAAHEMRHAVPAHATRAGGFEPPESLAGAVLAQAEQIDRAQAGRRAGALADFARGGAEAALGAPVGAAADAWLRTQAQGAAAREAADRGPRETGRRARWSWSAPLAGALAASVAIGVSVHLWQAQPMPERSAVPHANVATASEKSPARDIRDSLGAANAPAAPAAPTGARTAPPVAAARSIASAPSAPSAPSLAAARNASAPPSARSAPTARPAPPPLAAAPPAAESPARRVPEAARAEPPRAPGAGPGGSRTSAAARFPTESSAAVSAHQAGSDTGAPGASFRSREVSPRRATIAPMSYALSADPVAVAGSWPAGAEAPARWVVHAHPADEAAARAWLARLSRTLEGRARSPSMSLRLDGAQAGSLHIVPADER